MCSNGNGRRDLPRLNAEEMNYLKSFPSGYRFLPTDTELILQYLHNKVHRQPLPRNAIMNLDLYQFNPQYLADIYRDYGEREWYFFTPRDRNNSRLRVAGGGYWRGDAANQLIRHNYIIIGRKNTFTFYTGEHPNGGITDWIMNEFLLPNPPPAPQLDDCVLCQIYKESERRIPYEDSDSDSDSDEDEPESPRAEEMDNNNELTGDEFEPESPGNEQSPYQDEESAGSNMASPENIVSSPEHKRRRK